MNQTIARPNEDALKTAFQHALVANFVWINLSETVRYFLMVKPMLHAAFPGQDHIAAVTPMIFASWMVWDTILILAATGFYWMFLRQFGVALERAVLGATCFTLAVFGLIWLGVVNMGLAPAVFIWAALPLAWLEQIVAALLVLWTMRRAGIGRLE